MAEHLPEFIDPLVMAEKRRQFKGALPLALMSRLHDVLWDQKGEVIFELKFGKDGKVAAVNGLVEAKLKLQCQCCLGPIDWPVRCAVSLGIVHSIAEADLLPEPYEPLLLEAETIPLADLVQEELLLAIPAIPQHGQCQSAPQPKVEAVQDSPKRPNPFAVLADLKKSN